MIRSSKAHTFYTQHIPSNRFPASTIENTSLGKTASNLSIYIPYYPAQEDVNYVTKKEGPEGNAGLGFDSTKPPFHDMTGTGKSHSDDFAFLHPFKVLSFSYNYSRSCSFSRFPAPNLISFMRKDGLQLKPKKKKSRKHSCQKKQKKIKIGILLNRLKNCPIKNVI